MNEFTLSWLPTTAISQGWPMCQLHLVPRLLVAAFFLPINNADLGRAHTTKEQSLAPLLIKTPINSIGLVLAGWHAHCNPIYFIMHLNLTT